MHGFNTAIEHIQRKKQNKYDSLKKSKIILSQENEENKDNENEENMEIENLDDNDDNNNNNNNKDLFIPCTEEKETELENNDDYIMGLDNLNLDPDDDIVDIAIYDPIDDKKITIPIFKKNWKNIANLFYDLKNKYQIENFAGDEDEHFLISICTDSGSNYVKSIREAGGDIKLRSDKCKNHDGSGMCNSTIY